MFKSLGFLAFIAILVGGYGLYAGWFSVSKTTQAGETRINIGVNRDELSKDMQALHDKFGDLVEKLGGAAVVGTIERVDAQDRRIVLVQDGKELMLELAPNAAIELNGADTELGELQKNDDVLVQLEEEGSITATKIVAKR